MHGSRPTYSGLLLAACLALWPALPAQASAQLALDKGCYGCHGEPPRRNAPGFAQLAVDYARYRGQADAARQLADKLRAGGLFGHIAAHERISQAECEALMRWIIDGAR
jgi:cytochrome c